jgi:hypothetical protein
MFLWRTYVVANNKMYLDVHAKCPIILSDFNPIWSLYTDFLKKFPILNYMENIAVGDALMECGQTDGQDIGNTRFSRLCKRA